MNASFVEHTIYLKNFKVVTSIYVVVSTGDKTLRAVVNWITGCKQWHSLYGAQYQHKLIVLDPKFKHNILTSSKYDDDLIF